MGKKEIFVLILVAVCLLSVAMFMIGGALQDVDMHDIKTNEIPLEEQYDEYVKLDARRDVGETVQLIAAVITLVSMVGLMVMSVSISDSNAEKPLKRVITPGK